MNAIMKLVQLGSVFLNDSFIYEDIEVIINKVNLADGRFHESVWKRHGSHPHTKFELYRAVVASTLFFGFEACSCSHHQIASLSHSPNHRHELARQLLTIRILSAPVNYHTIEAMLIKTSNAESVVVSAEKGMHTCMGTQATNARVTC